MHQFDKWFKNLTHPWVIVCVLIFEVFSYRYWDAPLADYLHQFNLKLNFPPLYWFSSLGAASIYLVMLVVSALIVRILTKHKALEIRLWFLWFCVLIPSIVAFVLKISIGRARPFLWFDQHVFGIFGWHMESLYHSCPSGHTTTVTGLMIGLTILLPRYKNIWLFLAFCQILARVLLTYHYLSDVVISCYIVFLELALFFSLLRRVEHKKWLPSDFKRLCAIVS